MFFDKNVLSVEPKNLAAVVHQDKTTLYVDASEDSRTFSYFRNNPAAARAHGYHTIKPIKADGTRVNQADYEAVANGAYGGRAELGNGDYASGDGWKYRGRGLKQLTGRAKL